jgi:diguanylate cyclase (GGDEF)-like protein/PAS domain S-box-containing protein
MRSPARFVSIGLRIVFFSALSLVLTAAVFTWLQVHHFDNIEEQSWEQARQQGLDLAGRLFVHQSARLQSLATLVSDMPGLRVAMGEGDQMSLARVFSPFWSDLNLTHGIDRVAFYTPDGQLLGDWGTTQANGAARVLALQAGRQEVPAYGLDCHAICLFTAAVPLVERGKAVGSIVLSAGLQDLVMDFRGLSGAEVALLTSEQGDGGTQSAILGGRVLAVSGGAKYEELVRSIRIEEKHDDRFELERSGRLYQVFQFHPPVSGGEQVSFLVMRDATASSDQMSLAVWKSVTVGGGVLLVGLAILYLFLRPGMNRIQQAARALPLLGAGLFAEARGAFHGRKPKYFRDEVDDLGRLVYALANTLEQLQGDSRRHAEALQSQAEQLERERDFIAGLLDTAPVLILTTGATGRIRMANAHAIRTCGRSTGTVIGAQFEELFLTEEYRADHADAMKRLFSGMPLQDEGTLVRPDGGKREVVWFHSILEEASGERLVLSVGLDVTDHKQTERRMRLLADHDALTGMNNRRSFKRALDERLQQGERGILLVCDIDEFKAVNEVGGQEAGDAVLIQFSRLLLGLSPAPALSARLGGDDFACAFPGLSPAEAILLSRNLNQGLLNLPLGPEPRGARRLSVSVGVVTFPEQGGTADTLLGNADVALSQARAKGHGSWHLYNEDDPYKETLNRRAYWRGEVEQALEEDRFVMHFQPIQHILSGEISHYEALLRMRDRVGGLVPPGMFIDIAETTGLIRRVDRWVMQAVVQFLAQQTAPVKIALNLSSRSFDDDAAFEVLQVLLLRHKVAGERLLLEITETAALANISGATRVMAKFRSLGCAFGLDDFGVGYSSFQYLRELPVDFVKIDGSFIKGLANNPDNIVFVRALSHAVRGFGKATVAEFVEDEETLNILRELGIDYAQGYLIGRPAPALL